MHWIRNIAREVFGLFVDDGSSALAVLVWIGIIWAVSHHVESTFPAGILLFLGLSLVLVESVMRFSRRASSSRNS